MGIYDEEEEFLKSLEQAPLGSTTQVEQVQNPAPTTIQSDTQAPLPQNDASAPSETDADDDDDGEEVVIVGKDGKPRAKDGKFVSHQALHKEREKHKATKTELQQAREKLARGDERLAILNEAFQAQTRPAAAAEQDQQKPKNPYEEQTIDPEADFIGWAKQMQRRSEWNFQRQSEVQQSTAARETFQRVTNAYHEDARRFMSKEPNFEDAYKHLIANRHRELEATGMVDAARRSAFIAHEETQLVIQALQNGRSPSEVIYEFARARGFTPAAAQSQNAPFAAPAGVQPAGASQLPNASAASQKIQQVKNAQIAAQSLSNVSGGAAKTLTMEALASMSEEEFEAATKGLSKAQKRTLMGG